MGFPVSESDQLISYPYLYPKTKNWILLCIRDIYQYPAHFDTTGIRIESEKQKVISVRIRVYPSVSNPVSSLVAHLTNVAKS